MPNCARLHAVPERKEPTRLGSDNAPCGDHDIYIAVYDGRTYKHQARRECGDTFETHRWHPNGKCRDKFFGTHRSLQAAINAVIAKGGTVYHTSGREYDTAILDFLRTTCGA